VRAFWHHNEPDPEPAPPAPDPAPTPRFNTTFTYQGNRDVVDATVFGDTVRTYLTPNLGWGSTYKMTPKKETKLTTAELQIKLDLIKAQMADLVNELGMNRMTVSGTVSELEMILHGRRKQEARDRAALLLLDHLDDAQKEEWNRIQQFRVIGQKGNVYVVSDGGKVVCNDVPLCIYTLDHDIPGPDRALAAKLYIEANEAGFLKTANALSSAEFKMGIDGKVRNRKGETLNIQMTGPGVTARRQLEESYIAGRITNTQFQERLAALPATYEF